MSRPCIALVSHLEKEFGVHYAIGGVQAIADAMVRIVRKQGGTIRANTTVDRITFDGDTATGVRLTDGTEIPAALTVSNADAGHTYQTLMRDRPRKRWTDARLTRARWSMGLFVWYFGTRGTRRMWPDLGHHTILSGPRYEGLLRDIFIKGRLADDHSLYIHRPSVTDPTAAPDGDDTFYVLSPVPNLGHANPVDWSREEPIYRDKVAATLDTVMPGFRDHMAQSLIFTPDTPPATAISRPLARDSRWNPASCNPRGSARTTCPRRRVASTLSARARIPARVCPVWCPRPRFWLILCRTPPPPPRFAWLPNDL